MMHADAASADVIVVGAGPAGATVALLLARAGVHVLLLDRHQFPRPKPCGDCLSAGAGAILDRLDLANMVAALPHARLRGWHISAPDGSTFSADFPRGSYALAIERRLFDGTLVAAAVSAGAQLQRAHVTDVVRDARGGVTGVRTQYGTLLARMVIGADGLRSVIATRLDAVARPARLRKLSFTAHIERALVDDARGEMHVGDGVCAGIAPVTADLTRCNVTVVADAARYGRVAAADPRAFMLHTLNSLLHTRARVHAVDIADATLLASGPFDRPVQQAVCAGAALVGDAAGYFDPFTGQGVFQALASAELLAACVLRALAQPAAAEDHLRAYASGRRALMRGARMVQRGIDHVLARPALANRAIARIAVARPFAQAILGVTGDLAPASALLSPRALGSLIVPPR
jgi:flavin-dependent dehydrogenase